MSSFVYMGIRISGGLGRQDDFALFYDLLPGNDCSDSKKEGKDELLGELRVFIYMLIMDCPRF